jgi:hypothetical protein
MVIAKLIDVKAIRRVAPALALLTLILGTIAYGSTIAILTVLLGTLLVA